MATKVVIIGGGLSAKHAAEAVLKKGKGFEVTMIQANEFVEWPLAMTVCLVKPELHNKALAADKNSFQIKGVHYKYGVVESIDIVSKQVKLAKSDATVLYDALIVATGFGVPLVYPGLGVTLEERRAEVNNVGEAIKRASCVVVAGGGPIGLEMAGDIRNEYPAKRVVLLVRKDVLSQWPDAQKQKVARQLKKMNIEVMSGDSSGAPAEPSLAPGSFNIGGTTLSYDVFLPAYSKGPNTQFLKGTDIVDGGNRIDVNEFLQSKACKEMFAVGVSNVQEPFIGMPKLEAQWNSVAANVVAFLAGRALKAHKEGNAFMKLPPLVLIGHGPKGYGYCDFNNLPPACKVCCCCGFCGWPCCPPCWPCCACTGLGCCPCGVCCGPPEGSGPATFGGKMAFLSAGFHFKGVGQAPPQQKM